MLTLVIILSPIHCLFVYLDPISAVSVNPSGSPVEDMPFNLSCNVVGPVDSIQWLKNGTYLYADNTITFFNGNSTLSFKKLALTDDGLYTCAASNAVNNIESQAYNLMVNCEYDRYFQNIHVSCEYCRPID